jgi:hypothetical protein
MKWLQNWNSSKFVHTLYEVIKKLVQMFLKDRKSHIFARNKKERLLNYINQGTS